MYVHRLPPGVAEVLGYYVYLYVDPRNGRIFYVGKGRGNRLYAHLNDRGASEKARTIRELRAQGLEPRIEVLAHGLPDEITAFRVEMAAIDLIGVRKLTNEVRGYQSGVYGRMGLGDLIAQIAALPVEVVHPVLLIVINRRYHYGMSKQELYEVTRGVWKVGLRRERAEYGLAVYDGVVREVYSIDSWHPAGTTPYLVRPPGQVRVPGRWEFTGRRADDDVRDRYLRKSVRHYLPPGGRNPIRYVNC